MLFRNIPFIIATAAFLVMAGGSRPQESPQDGAGNGMNGDTTEVVGTVESVSPQDSMFVITTDEGQDTIYFDSETEFTLGGIDVIRPNTQVRVMYITKEDRMVATRIQPAATDGGAQKDTGEGAQTDTGSGS